MRRFFLWLCFGLIFIGSTQACFLEPKKQCDTDAGIECVKGYHCDNFRCVSDVECSDTKSCPGNLSCLKGKCQCKGESLLCDDLCVDDKRDSRHCGACNKACQAGDVCHNAECVTCHDTLPCRGGLICRAGRCEACDSTENKCPQGQRCVQGPGGRRCVCGRNCGWYIHLGAVGVSFGDKGGLFLRANDASPLIFGSLQRNTEEAVRFHRQDLQLGKATNVAQGFIAEVDSYGRLVWISTSAGSKRSQILAAVSGDIGSPPKKQTRILGNLKGKVSLSGGSLTLDKATSGDSDAWMALLDERGLFQQSTLLKRGQSDQPGANAKAVAITQGADGSYDVLINYDVSFAQGGERHVIFLQRFDAQGRLQRAEEISHTSYLRATAMVRDSQGNLYIAGELEEKLKVGMHTLGSENGEAFVLQWRVQGSGKQGWGWAIQSHGTAEITSLAVDKTALYMTGAKTGYIEWVEGAQRFAMTGQADAPMPFVMRVDVAPTPPAQGRILWSMVPIHTTNTDGQGVAVALSSKYVVVAGKLRGKLEYSKAMMHNQSVGSSQSTGAKNYDIFLWALDKQGAGTQGKFVLAPLVFGQIGDESPYGLQVNTATKAIYLLHSFTSENQTLGLGPNGPKIERLGIRDLVLQKLVGWLP